MREKRELATIMSVDVAGYSRSTEKDDAAAAEAVRKLRDCAGDAVTRTGGRIFNTAGDGLMASFPTASAAAQAALWLLKSECPPIRIGIHLGEVIVAEGGDLLGHTVNMAARLQSLAEPGTALLSDAVRAQLRPSFAAPLKSLGRVQLQKMVERVGVHALVPRHRPTWFGKLRSRRYGKAALIAAAAALVTILAVTAVLWRTRAPGPPTVAVLAFDPVGADEASKAFAHAFSNELHYYVSRSGPNLELVGRGAIDQKELAGAGLEGLRDRLHVTHWLTGSVERAGEEVTVTAELVDARRDREIWRDRVTRDVKDIQALLTQVTRRARDALRIASSADAGGPAIDGRAMDLYFSANWRGGDAYVASQMAASGALEQAVAIAPNFTRAWYSLAYVNAALRISARTDTERRRALARGKEAAARLRALTPDSADAWVASSWFASPEEGRADLEKAGKLDPGHPEVLATRAWRLLTNGRGEDAHALAERAFVMDPMSHRIQRIEIMSALMSQSPKMSETSLADVPPTLAVEYWPVMAIAWLARGDLADADKALAAGRAALEAVGRDQASGVDAESATADARASLDQVAAIADALRGRDLARRRMLADRLAARLADGARRTPAERLSAYAIDLPAVAMLNGAEAALAAWGRRLDSLPRLDKSDPASPQRAEAAALAAAGFYPGFAPLRRDARFWTYRARLDPAAFETDPRQAIGSSELWPPDFCRMETLTYDCEAAARSALGNLAARKG